MDENQSKILRLSNKGHNLLITGYPGSGKSYLLSKIIEQFHISGNIIAITSSTGMSARALKVQFGEKTDFNVQTVHKYFGLRDGRYTNDELLNLINNHEKFESIKENIIKIKGVVLDEISMISRKTFEQIEFILRNVRQSKLVFGGVQIIICGDFHQLAPVPNLEYDDDGSPCYTSVLMSLFHHCQLFGIHRQKETDLIQGITELARGALSLATVQLFSRLKRPLPPGPDPVHLFATNFDVDVWNSNCLCNLEGQEKIYISEDTGDSKVLDRFSRVEKKLHLKIGAPVILLVNLSDDLVNGLCGIVKEMNDDEVLVSFLNKNHRIRQYSFTHYSKKMKMDVASRKQIPLKLAYSLTVHRSQGLTIPRVHVHSTFMNQPGQITVALSRAPCKKDLRVEGFDAKKCPKPSEDLTNFDFQIQRFPLSNLTCCRHVEMKVCEKSSEHGESHETRDITQEQEDDSDIDYLDDELKLFQIIEDIHFKDVDYEYKMPDTVSIQDILQLFYCDHTVTAQQTEENDAVNYLKSIDISNFVNFLWNSFMKIKDSTFPQGEQHKIDNKISAAFFKAAYKFQSSKEYQSQVSYIFNGTPSKSQYNVVFKLSCHLRKLCLDSVAEPIREAARIKAERERGKKFIESTGGLGKIRYLAGWCVHSVRKRKQRLIRGKLYNVKEVGNIQKLKAEMELLGQIESRESNTEEIERRQNIRKGLTNVSDKCAVFFECLDNHIRQLESEENINLYGKDIGNFIQTSLTNDQSLLNKFSELFIVTFDYDIELLGELFSEIIEKYCLMSLAQLRKEYIHKHEVEKTEAHRKQIKMKSKSSDAAKFNIKNFLDDKSEGKIISHKRLQYEIVNNGEFLTERFSKTDMKHLCDFYNVAFHSSHTKSSIAEKLKEKILNFEKKHTETSPPSDQLPSSSTSIIPQKRKKEIDTDIVKKKEKVEEHKKDDAKKGRQCVRKGKGKGKKKKGKINYPCGVCGEECSVDCVGCDGCNIWFHSVCVKIDDLDNLPDEWFCQPCIEALEL